MKRKINPMSELTPEDVVNDYLIGRYEIEKLKNGFQAPVNTGQPCAEHRHRDEGADSRS